MIIGHTQIYRCRQGEEKILYGIDPGHKFVQPMIPMTTLSMRTMLKIAPFLCVSSSSRAAMTIYNATFCCAFVPKPKCTSYSYTVGPSRMQSEMVTPRMHLEAFSSRLNFANFKLTSTMALPAWSRHHGSSCKWPLFRRQTKSHPNSRLATLCLCTALSLQTCGWKPQTCQSNHGRTRDVAQEKAP
jgi:hypothetical protein